MAGPARVLRVDLFSLNGLIAHVTYSEAVVVVNQLYATFSSPLRVSGMTFFAVTQVNGVPAQLHFQFSQRPGGPPTMAGLPWAYQDDSPYVVARRGSNLIRGLSGKFP